MLRDVIATQRLPDWLVAQSGSASGASAVLQNKTRGAATGECRNLGGARQWSPSNNDCSKLFLNSPPFSSSRVKLPHRFAEPPFSRCPRAFTKLTCICVLLRNADRGTAAQPASWLTVLFTCCRTPAFPRFLAHNTLTFTMTKMLRVSKLLTRLLIVTRKLVGLQERETITHHRAVSCQSAVLSGLLRFTQSATTPR